ncbi:MAG: gamma-glutamyl-gamma-aminobutyrate hydrolase family protein [Anaerolineae bacterium]
MSPKLSRAARGLARIGLPMFTVHTPAPRWMMSPAYVRAVRIAGGLPIPIPLETDRATLEAYLADIDGLLLCGGGDLAPETYGAPDGNLCEGIDQDRDAVELYLASRAAELDLPTLGICRGVQVMNVAACGTLIQDIRSQHSASVRHRTPPSAPRDTLAHAVRLDLGVLSGLQGPVSSLPWPTSGVLRVNSTHHQAVARVAAPFAVAATAEDGIIEALVTTEGRFRLGVQWHPEELLSSGHDGLHRSLFEGLVRAAQWGEA